MLMTVMAAMMAEVNSGDGRDDSRHQQQKQP
jgi:hypothetical protein